MKLRKSVRGCRNAFTLVELLVVIGIIALLAAILLPAMNAALKKAELVRAKTEIAGLVAAIKAYYTEYGVMPTPGGSDWGNGFADTTYMGKTVKGQRPQNLVISMLISNNPRRITFLEIPPDASGGKALDKDGNGYETSDGFFVDPWGNPYIICMDTSFDGKIKFSEIDVGGEIAWLNNLDIPALKVGVISYGPGPYVEVGGYPGVVLSNKLLTSWWP